MKQLVLVCGLLSIAVMMCAVSPVYVEDSFPEGLKLRFSAPELQISAQQVGSESFHELKMADSQAPVDFGNPELPIYSTSIILPPSGSYVLDVQVLRQRTISNIRPLPVMDEQSGKREYDPAKYYAAPERPLVESSAISILRDFRILQLSINPLRWNAENSELTVMEEFDITLRYTDAPTATDMEAYRGYSPAFRKLYEANLVNFADYRSLTVSENYGRILMIHANNTSSEYMEKIQAFARWKRQKGHEVNLVNVQTAGSSNYAIKSFIQTQYDNPDTRPDYIILIGDTPQIPTFFENFSSYSGEGDYPYTHLAGNDLLGDVFIGRISVESVSQLSVVLSKIYRYERDINNDPTAASWVNRILLVGDPSYSGISCIYNSKYIKEMAKRVNPDYNFFEHYTGSASSAINSAINQGVNFFSYRGYIGMSGWNPSSALVNNPRYPHAVILTCGTGSFGSSYGPGTTEEFIRLGTEANPTGAVTAIGMATSGTHTMFNNTLNAGIFNGILAYGMRSMGEALLNGRLFIKEVYSATHDTEANYFSHWCNLMGDPSMEVFIGIPENLVIAAPASLPLGSTMIDLSVQTETGEALPNVSVTALDNGTQQIVARGYTDSEGNLSMFISGGLQHALTLTAAKNDFKPSTGTVELGEGGIVYFDKIIYDNGEHGSIGNSDSFAEAGEKIALMLTVKNTDTETLSGLSATVSSDEEDITLFSDELTFGDIPAGAHAMANEAILVEISEELPGNQDIRLLINVEDATGASYEFPLHFAAYNAILEVEATSISAGGDDVLDPTETGTLQLSIRNQSIAGVQDITAELFSLNDLVVVQDAESYVGSISAGYLASTLDGFEIFARSILIPGMQIPFRVRLTNSEGFAQDAFFNIMIGNVDQNTPMGPDSYGYFIYAENDTAFSDCPEFDWIEINPSQGGQGALLNTLNDSGTSSDEGDQYGSNTLEVVDLPFPFSFYGETYNQITVCVNGFIAMGITENGEFRNSRLPGGMGPAPMIAAFWDDLILISDAGVYKYYDAQSHSFIIEYYKMRNGFDRNSIETFQVIFYDPVYHPTSLGDGKIKIQYLDFNNVDVGGGGYPPRHGNYATIGIKDHSNTQGLEYSYNNQYAPAATPLSNHTALTITTVPVLHETPYLIVQDLIVNDPNSNGTAEPGESIQLGIRLINQGINPAEDTSISVTMDNAYAVLQNSESAYPEIPGDESRVNIEPIGISVSEDCPDNSILQLLVHVVNGNSEWSYPISLTVQKPSLSLSAFCMNDAQGNGNGLVDPGESFDLVLNYQNQSEIDASNITSNIMSLSEYVTITNPGALIPKVPAGEIAQVMYEVSISPDAPLGNNLTFYITYLGDLIAATNEQLMISVGTTGMNEDFEADDGDFEPNPIYYAWEWGISNNAGAHSGAKVWGTVLNSSYTANANWQLTTPSVYVGNNFMLEFWHWYNMENNYDGGNVQISIDNSSTWSLLTPEGGYPHNNINALGGPGFSGTSGGWIRCRIPLTAYASHTVKFRFHFASDSYTQSEGWFIDDVRTTGYLEFVGKISGNITSSDAAIDFNKVLISNTEGITTFADQDGDYRLYLPMGTQQIFTEAEGYYSIDPVSIQMSPLQPVATQDFYLGYFKPVLNAAYNVADSVLTLSWDPPEDTEFPVIGYGVYKRFGASAFELVNQYTNPGYQENLALYGEYKYYIRALYAQGQSVASPILEFNWGGVSNPQEHQLPAFSGINGNYPNPFNPETTIAFTLNKPSLVRLSVYNIKGQKVKSLLQDTLAAGEYNKVWNGRDEHNRAVSSGLYFFRLETEDSVYIRKAMLMK
ncbi:MAG: hypothetical protein PWP64_173 [Candidatus Cloacimonadota bacterium]|nr:hypothetical protein [Candidatus Cloacimonadota bacterium]